jgi:hypothetical protein
MRAFGLLPAYRARPFPNFASRGSFQALGKGTGVLKISFEPRHRRNSEVGRDWWEQAVLSGALGGVGCATMSPEMVFARKIVDNWKTKCGIFAAILCA